jgi:hypothetical protein
LDLAAHVHAAAQEVDVADLQGGGLAEPQPGEGAQADKGTEPRV